MRLDSEPATIERKRLYGVYPAQVTDLKDSKAQGRIKVKLPWAPDADGGFEVWARLSVPLAGNNRGSWLIPDVGDEVLVAFEAGDPRHPCVIGSLWNGADSPPETMDGAGNNYKKVIRSRNGVKITLDDNDGQEQLIVETPGGQKLTLKDSPASIELIDSNGNSVKLEAAGITVQASAKVKISAGTIEMSAGMVKVDAGMSNFSGVVKSDTVITNTVISSSYTPGAGNIW